MQAFGHLPSAGETTTLVNYHFKVTRADSRHIIQVQVTLPHAKPIAIGRPTRSGNE